MSFLSKSYHIVLDRAIDTPGHGKDVVDGFNIVQKRYLATCLRMRSTPEKDKIDSKRMRVEAMTEQCGIKHMDAQSSIGVPLPTILCLIYQHRIKLFLVDM